MITINKDLKLRYKDLLEPVNPNSDFTLRDVFQIIYQSSLSVDGIPIAILGEIAHFDANYFLELYEEMNSRPFESPTEDMTHLEVYWEGHSCKCESINESMWICQGVGPNDVFSLDMSPMYSLSDYKIRIGSKMVFQKSQMVGSNVENIDFQPTITVIELLECVMGELTFFKDLEGKKAVVSEIKMQVDQIEKATQDGTIDQLMYSWEDAQKRLLEKLKGRTNGL